MASIQSTVSSRRPAPAGGDSRWRVKSASRTMDIVEYFHDVRRPARVIEVAQALGVPSSSACELLKTLVDSGHLSFDDRGKTYFPSYRMARIASWLGGVYRDASLHDMVNALADESGESVALTAQCGTQMEILAMRAPAHGVTNDLIEGSRVPIVGSISGAGLLMAKPNNEMQRIIARSIHLRGADSKKSTIATIMESVSEFRRTGYAFSETSCYGSISLAVPLPRGATPMQMVLGCGGPPARMRDRSREVGRAIRNIISRYF
jgi:DNA-binding IclR family transcriptional regulator